MIMIKIEPQGLPQQILCTPVNPCFSCLSRHTHQTVKMMKTFDVGRKASSMFRIDLDLIMSKSSLFGLCFGNYDGSICIAVRAA